MNKPLHEYTVLITGASRGIGAAIAERFAQVGMNIVIHYRSSHEAANEVARSCLSLGSQVLTVSADISQKQEIEKMREKLEGHDMLPDILINNAGISHYGLFQDISEEAWDQVMNVNLKGLFLCTQAFLPEMIRKKWGRIINISSVWGQSGASCEAAYAATKGGINALTKSLAKELAPSHITVNAIAPGVVDTEMMNHLDHGEKQALQSEIPAGRFAQPNEIASLAYFLSLPESSYITGQIISPNGGWVT
ncbi:elongation factor P 5-aminopentanone reductase [Marinicrinis sediminis]|uniref:Elongation factor P 5-aminopentanone reductase n=1 Tax=Marinicrinis sediminis TaxID=1652465 RepID=A0ABW5R532_9BACL